ncbi:hypothetical protein FGG08_003402 [Glutinoglossum americanum]|uniref:MIF4G domain-containing protein n=1 Tax=Glutinoglossum americanum TaxID=1670608 RepID=A0A9P8IDC6_9PEZI|nr:hypothetical protein FGG08_003402 [Glutinoglossum americanum]
MTSIPQQPSNPPQALSSTNATQNATSAHNPSSSISGTSSSHAAAVPAAAGRTYANATKSHVKSSSVSPVNGKNPIPPAVPAVVPPTIVNSNNAVNGAGRGDHSRNPSVVNSATGQGGWMPNGGPPPGPPSRNSIQFGSINTSGSPAENHGIPPHQHTPSLSAALPNNPRVTSPQTSPSPIPQPSAASGGRPPSGLQGQGNMLSFGSLGGSGESSRPMRPVSMSQPPLAPNNQSRHLRQESAQSAHSDMGNGGMGPGSRYPPQGGRGRGYNQQYSQHQQMGYPPGPAFRSAPNQPRNVGMPPQFQGPVNPYPNSPHRSSRSPAITHAAPGTPQMAQVSVANPSMQSPQYGYQPMGPPQAQFQIPSQFDPAYHYQYSMYPPQMPYMAGPPSSPRPPYQHVPAGGQQQYAPGQYGPPQPSSMSRTSSAVSEQRPNSSLGQPQIQSITPAISHTLHPSHSASSPAPDANLFKKPKGNGIVVKNPNSGVVLDFSKQPASPAPVSRSPVIVSSTPTPPPGPGSRNDSPHNKAESKSSKTAEEVQKEMKDRVAKKIEDEKREIEERARRDKEEAELAAKKEAEEEERREREKAEIARKEAEEKARKEKEEEERIQKEKEELARREAEEKAKAEEEERKEAARLAEEKAEEEARAARAKAKEEERLKEEELAKEKELLNTPASLSTNLSRMSISGASTPASDDSMGPPAKPSNAPKREKPPSLNLAPLKTGSVEPAQPSAALTSLRSARPIGRLNDVKYPQDIASPNPALNAAAPMGKFKYEKDFLMQFQNVFVEKPSLDWDIKIKETVGDTPDSARPQSARPSSSLGPRNPSGRPGLPSGFSMGNFGQPGGKSLPPGTTSEQRFAISMGPQRTGMSSMNNPLAQFARQGGFPQGGSTSMSRTNSSTTLQSQGGAPQSPRTGSGRRSQRGSDRGKGPQQSSKAEEQAAKAMPLTANAEVKPLTISNTGWKPRSLVSAATGAAGPTPGSGGLMEPDMVQRKVKAALNKMTPEKFDKISDQILEIASQSKHETDGRTLRQVIQLTFEKATDEAHWASMYARFCKRMLEAMDPSIKDESIRDKNGNVVVGGNLFRKYLLNRCQEEFERGWKLNLGVKPEGETEEAAMLSEEYYIAAAAKRRGLGLVQFIGELYKLGMLTERIMHECVKKLVDYEGVPEEAEVESLTKLLKTIGRNLDSTDKGKPMMDAYFQRIQIMIDTPELPNRLRFMLMDVVDLRRKSWNSKDQDKGPKTIAEIREEVEAAAVAKESERSRQNQRVGGRGPGGRGDARSFSSGGQYGMNPPPDYQKNTVGMDDLRRLTSKGGNRQVSQGPATFGPTAMFSSRSGSSGGRKNFGSGLQRGGEESGASSRTATPPAQKDKESTSHANMFSALAGQDAPGEPNDPTSPSTASSPPMVKARLEEGRAKSPVKEDLSGAS